MCSLRRNDTLAHGKSTYLTHEPTRVSQQRGQECAERGREVVQQAEEHGGGRAEMGRDHSCRPRIPPRVLVDLGPALRPTTLAIGSP